jgi:peptidoglycan/xylan/chitin deacetylase (PgdA/CDA1 family)
MRASRSFRGADERVKGLQAGVGRASVNTSVNRLQTAAPRACVRPRAGRLLHNLRLALVALATCASLLCLPAGAASADNILAVAEGSPVSIAPTLGETPPVGAPVRYRPVGCVRRGPIVAYGHGPRRKEVALSFDDGPYPLTPSFVRMLKANGAVATFFMIGEQVTARYRSTLHEELRDGDALGDHTYTHPDLVTAGGVRSQLERTIQAIRALSGYTPCVFRPPYGDYNSSVLSTAASLGLATILWEVDPSDYTLPGISAIRERVLSQVRPGAIVISHDGGGPRAQTLAAYPAIISALRARGYRFVTVPQLLGFREVYKRCVRDCEGAAIVGRPPPGSIVEPG